jgi:hypothetical protein
MTGSAERPKAQRTIGRFSVVTDPILIRRFQDATLLGESDRTAYDVPLTLPIAWLGMPEIKTDLLAALGENAIRHNRTLLHLEQNFEYLAPLEIGRS